MRNVARCTETTSWHRGHFGLNVLPFTPSRKESWVVQCGQGPNLAVGIRSPSQCGPAFRRTLGRFGGSYGCLGYGCLGYGCLGHRCLGLNGGFGLAGVGFGLAGMGCGRKLTAATQPSATPDVWRTQYIVPPARRGRHATTSTSTPSASVARDVRPSSDMRVTEPLLPSARTTPRDPTQRTRASPAMRGGGIRANAGRYGLPGSGMRLQGCGLGKERQPHGGQYPRGGEAALENAQLSL